VFKSYSGNPNIILGNGLSFSRQIGFDLAIEMRGAFMWAED